VFYIIKFLVSSDRNNFFCLAAADDLNVKILHAIKPANKIIPFVTMKQDAMFYNRSDLITLPEPVEFGTIHSSSLVRYFQKQCRIIERLHYPLWVRLLHRDKNE
jgi:hypothetical protein